MDEYVVNGPFTRYQTNDPLNTEKQSCLDLAIISEGLQKYIEVLEIDKHLRFTPGYSNGKKIKYSDHFGMKIVFKDIPLKDTDVKITKKREPICNLNKKGGWEKYFHLTDKNTILICGS